MICDIDRAGAERVENEIGRRVGKALSVLCDVSQEAHVETAVLQAVQALGGIDIVINCVAKNLLEYSRPLTVMPRDKWRRMLDVNVTGIINSAAATREIMKQRGGRVILKLSSISGFNSRDSTQWRLDGLRTGKSEMKEES